MKQILNSDFFARSPLVVAQDLLGKIIRRYCDGHWLSVQIIETEAYCLEDKASHASLGFTEKRKALFMPPGTIYMYYSRGRDSLNVSCKGEGAAVLIKSAYPYQDKYTSSKNIEMMQLKYLNNRPIQRLCNGQTLLCQSLDLRVRDWDTKAFCPYTFYFSENDDYKTEKFIQTKRLGIPKGRDEHLMYRFIDYQFAEFCTQNPLKKRNFKIDKDYIVHH